MNSSVGASLKTRYQTADFGRSSPMDRGGAGGGARRSGGGGSYAEDLDDEIPF